MSAQDKDKPVNPGKGLASVAATTLTDEEVTNITQVVGRLVQKYSHLPPTENNLARLDDEATDQLYRLGYLVHVDIDPVLEGKPPVIDIMGKIGDYGFQKDHDHERSRYHVLKSKEKNEPYHGAREPVNTIPAKRRAKEDHKRKTDGA